MNGRQISEVVRIKGQVAKPTAANQKYAARLAEEIRRKLLEGTYRHADYFPASATGTTGRGTNVADALDTWLKTQTITDSTRRAYVSAVDGFWKPTLGNTSLVSLKKSDILLAIKERRPKWSGKTKNNKLSVLRGALQLAVDDGVIDTNPCDAIRAFEHQKPEVDPFTAEERDKILTYFEEHALEPVWNYFAHQFWTGLRTEVELPKRWITIKQGLVDGKLTDETKTKRIRAVDLNPYALEALTRQAKFSKLAGGRVFTNPATGEPWADDQQPRKIWQRALLRLGIRYRDPYNTRHTYATTMLMAGLKPAYVARQLGHSVPVLLDRYARWLDGEDNEREQAKLVEFVSATRKADQAKAPKRAKSGKK